MTAPLGIDEIWLVNYTTALTVTVSGRYHEMIFLLRNLILNRVSAPSSTYYTSQRRSFESALTFASIMIRGSMHTRRRFQSMNAINSAIRILYSFWYTTFQVNYRLHNTKYTNTYSKGLRGIRDLPLEAWRQNSYPAKRWEGCEFWLQAERDKSRIPRQTFAWNKDFVYQLTVMDRFNSIYTGIVWRHFEY